MYVSHPVFIEPNCSNLPIWRYMDFWKFLNLLELKSLYFSNSENLGDNYEGRIPSFVLEKIEAERAKGGNIVNKHTINYLENVARKTFLISS